MPSTYVSLLYHIVFRTKHSLPMIKPEVQPVLYQYIGGIAGTQRGVLIEAGGMPDHVHLLLSLRTTPSLAEVVKNVKGGSSRWMNLRSEDGERFGWQDGYGAFTVSPSQLNVVRRYIQSQEEHHRKMTFGDEWDSLVRKHGIAFGSKRLGPASSRRPAGD